MVAEANDQHSFLSGGFAQSGHPFLRAFSHPEITRHQKHSGLRFQKPRTHLPENFPAAVAGVVEVEVGGDENFSERLFTRRKRGNFR